MGSDQRAVVETHLETKGQPDEGPENTRHTDQSEQSAAQLFHEHQTKNCEDGGYRTGHCW